METHSFEFKVPISDLKDLDGLLLLMDAYLMVYKEEKQISGIIDAKVKIIEQKGGKAVIRLTFKAK